jgi:RND family efflux transporter MFP subunit
MKSNILLASTLAGLLLVGCEPTAQEQLDEKKAELKEKKTEIAELKKSISELQEQVKDTSVKEIVKIPVAVQKVVQEDFESFFEVHGVVATDQNIMVNPEMSGLIKQIKVREGQRVKKGQVLAVIDTELINRQIKEVEKGLEFAVQVFQKQENLQKKNVGTEIQFLEAKNRKESLEKTLESLRAQLNKAFVKAPISGTIDEIFPNVGELGGPQAPLVRMVNISDVFVKADIAEAHLGKVKVGDKVDVRLSSINEEVKGKVTYVGNYINAMNRTFLVHVDIPNPKGMYLPNLLSVVKIRNAYEKEAVVIPSKVLQNDGKHTYVFTVENGIAHKKSLTVGVSYGGKVVVKEGLTVNEQVVVKGQTSLVEGSAIEVK